ncbi:hypothetical protein ACLKA6_018298 [Drosophila palustris]
MSSVKPNVGVGDGNCDCVENDDGYNSTKVDNEFPTQTDAASVVEGGYKSTMEKQRNTGDPQQEHLAQVLQQQQQQKQPQLQPHPQQHPQSLNSQRQQKGTMRTKTTHNNASQPGKYAKIHHIIWSTANNGSEWQRLAQGRT